MSALVRTAQANARAADLAPVIKKLQAAGAISLRAIELAQRARNPDDMGRKMDRSTGR